MTRFVLCALGFLVAGTASAAENRSAGPVEICKAAIATIMDRDPLIMRARQDGTIIHVEYVLREGGAVWGYRCRLDGRRVMWASAKGWWNTHSKDAVITFEIADNQRQVTITERQADGSKEVKSFSLAKLQ
jgi:hypothetical protein